MKSKTSGTKTWIALLTSGRYVWKMKTIEAGQSWRSLKDRIAGACTTGCAAPPEASLSPPIDAGGPIELGLCASPDAGRAADADACERV